ncbi:MAG: DUF928 domain-containing protein [Cyanobacteria bacterium P01_F01_bin.150]
MPILHKKLLGRWFAVSVITAIAGAIVIAPAMAGYIPPTGSSTPRRGSTGTNIVRGGGCSAASTASLTALAPQSHIGQTASLQPTFVWFNPEAGPYTVEFRIAEYLPDDSLKVIYRHDFTSVDRMDASGISVFDLSETDISLASDTVYRWQVILVCNPNRPSESLVTASDIEVVNLPNALDMELATKTESSDRANLYAESGLWYDALAEAINGSETGTNDVQIGLLETLVELEGEAEGENGRNYGDRLQEVINVLYTP